MIIEEDFTIKDLPHTQEGFKLLLEYIDQYDNKTAYELLFTDFLCFMTASEYEAKKRTAQLLFKDTHLFDSSIPDIGPLPQHYCFKKDFIQDYTNQTFLHFYSPIPQLTAQALNTLRAYQYPGNAEPKVTSITEQYLDMLHVYKGSSEEAFCQIEMEQKLAASACNLLIIKDFDELKKHHTLETLFYPILRERLEKEQKTIFISESPLQEFLFGPVYSLISHAKSIEL